jgi:hypothetical protein
VQLRRAHAAPAGAAGAPATAELAATTRPFREVHFPSVTTTCLQLPCVRPSLWDSRLTSEE